MENENEILSQFMNTITQLEREQETLKQTLASKQKELKQLQTFEQPKSKSSKTISTPSLQSINFNEPSFEYLTLNQNKEKILLNLTQHTFNYVPIETTSSAYIMGDFTNWEPVLMNKQQINFSYTTVLIKGFKYYYTYSTNEEPVIDYYAPYETNPKTKTIQNYIELPHHKKQQQISLFDSSQDKQILDINRRNYYILQSDSIEEAYFLDKLKEYLKVYSSQHQIISTDKHALISSIDSYYAEHKRKLISQEQSQLLMEYLSTLEGRVVQKEQKVNQVSTLSLFKIVKVVQYKEINTVELLPLYDHNGIKTDKNYYVKNYLYARVNVSQLTCDKNKRNALYYLLPLNESNSVIKEYESNENENDNILKVYVNQDNINDEKNPKNYGVYSKTVVMPTKVEPNRLKHTDYSLLNEKCQFVYAKNVHSNMYVKFIVVNDNNGESIKDDNSNKLDKNISKNDNKDKQNKNKVKPLQMLIYYTIQNNKIILIHSHILDKELEGKTISLITITTSTDYKKIKYNDSYINRKEILFLERSLMPFKLYYNKHKVQAKFNLITKNRLYQISSQFQSNCAFKDMYVQIEHIPLYTSTDQCSFELAGECENIPFYETPTKHCVDVLFLFDQNKTPIDEMLFSFTPCMLTEVDPKESYKMMQRYNEERAQQQHQQQQTIQQSGNNYPQKQENVNEAYEIKKFLLIIDGLNNFDKYQQQPNLIKKLTKDEIEDNIFILEDYQSSLNGIVRYVENNELWDYLGEIDMVSSKIKTLISLFTK